MKSIVSDWNGTIYKEVDETKTYKGIALAYRNRLIRKVIHLNPIAAGKLVKLLIDKKEIEKAKSEYDNGKRKLEEVYKEFNERIVSKLDSSSIMKAVYDISTENKNKVDKRLLESFKEIRKLRKIQVGILSVAYETAIFCTLLETDYQEVFYYPKITDPDVLRRVKEKELTEEDALERYGEGASEYHIIGDKLIDKNGKDVDESPYAKHEGPLKFALRTYRKKGIFLEDEFARKRGYSQITYFGDTEDDISCFDYVTSNRGRVVLPFFLIERAVNDVKSREFLRKATEKYNAFVPKDEADLKNFLDKD